MRRQLGIGLLLAAALAGAAFAAAGPGQRIYADYAAGQSLKTLIVEGKRIVPVRQHPHMRGNIARDYRCFADGLCFYAIDVFRRLYPAYNDLDDDALLNELRARNAMPQAELYPPSWPGIAVRRAASLRSPMPHHPRLACIKKKGVDARHKAGHNDVDRPSNHSAAMRVAGSTASILAAQNLNSGIFPNGSSFGLVSRFAAAST
jgi:hypothetical protein